MSSTARTGREFDVIVRIYETEEKLLQEDTWTIQTPSPGTAASRAFNLSVDEIKGRGKKMPRKFDRALMVVRPK